MSGGKSWWEGEGWTDRSVADARRAHSSGDKKNGCALALMVTGSALIAGAGTAALVIFGHLG